MQVSPPQREPGFKVGETVIRGNLVGSEFIGQVLRKPVQGSPSCKGVTVGSLPIRMTFNGPLRPQGLWLQEWVGDSQGCVVVDQSWQPCRLERLPSN